MRKLCVLAATAAIGWAAVPPAMTLVGVGSLATVTLLASGQAEAGTALLPGWRYPCGRNPRCFDRAEARRRARLAAQSMRSQ